MANMDLWNKYATPPAEALKEFDNGNFKGTDISPMWRIRCLTEEFGQCGLGWFTEVKEHWTDTVETSDVEQCVTTHMRIWLYYCDPVSGEWSKPVEGVGGNTMTLYSRKYKSTRANDEAYKMAYTDALGNACKALGFGGSIYWERGYSKYEESYVEPVQPAKPKAQAEETPVPKDSREEALYRMLCLKKIALDKLNASCLRKFGTDFRHTPAAELKKVLPEEMLNGMEDYKG